MGTSVRVIERHYGALLDGAGADIAARLDALDLERDRPPTSARARRRMSRPQLGQGYDRASGSMLRETTVLQHVRETGATGLEPAIVTPSRSWCR
jgi:hypothetical protein